MKTYQKFLLWGGWLGCLAAQGLTLDALEKLARSQRELSGFVDGLFQMAPEFRQNFLLIPQSRSLQFADTLHPRTIIFSDDARWIFAMESEETAKNIEVIEFTPDDRFHFHQLEKSPTGSWTLSRDSSKCARCHREDLRPNWEPYPVWPGTFGSIAHGGTDSIFLTLEGAETDQFYRFLETSSLSLSPYRQLGDIRLNYSPDPEPDYYSGRQPPNNEFTQKVGYLNFRRITRKIRNSPDYAKYKFAFMAAGICENFPSFIPEGIRKHFSENYRQVGARIRRVIRDTQLEKHELYGAETYLDQIRDYAYLLENRGVSVEDWALSLKDRPYRFTVPTGSINLFVSSLLAEQDADLAPFAQHTLEYVQGDMGVLQKDAKPQGTDWTSFKKKSCAALKLHSLSALSTIPQP